MASCPTSPSSSNIVRLLNINTTIEQSRHLLTELTGHKDEVLGSVQWSVDNKYYTATLLITVHQFTDKIQTPLEAIVFLCDLEKSGYLEKVKNLWSSLNDSIPSVCLLVGVVRGGANEYSKTLRWCTDNGVELVTWNIINHSKKGDGEGEGEGQGEEGEGQGEDDGEGDQEGIIRISQALQAHMWPEMNLKGNNDNNDSPHRSTDQGEPSFEDVLLYDPLSSKGVEPDPGGESFEDLFERFASMKAHAETLPFEERRDYAERVVMSFWKAIGGDEEELDLTTDD